MKIRATITLSLLFFFLGESFFFIPAEALNEQNTLSKKTKKNRKLNEYENLSMLEESSQLIEKQKEKIIADETDIKEEESKIEREEHAMEKERGKIDTEDQRNLKKEKKEALIVKNETSNLEVNP